MKKVFKLKTPNTKSYIQLLNGLFNLTGKEIEVLTAFIEMQQVYPDMNVFSSEFKKQIAEQLGMNNFNVLNVYIKNLVDKNAIIRKDRYVVNPALLLKEDQTAIELRWKDEPT